MTEREVHIKRLLSLAEAVREASKRLPDTPVSAEVVACAGIMGMANWLEDVAGLLRAEPVGEPVARPSAPTEGGETQRNPVDRFYRCGHIYDNRNIEHMDCPSCRASP